MFDASMSMLDLYSVLVSMSSVYFIYMSNASMLVLVLDAYSTFVSMSNAYSVYLSNVYSIFVSVYMSNVDSMFMTMPMFNVFSVLLECMSLLFATSMSFEIVLLLLLFLCLMNLMFNSFVLCPTCSLLLHVL